MGMIFQNGKIYSGATVEIQPVIYSENEREIGVWVDGKPLYEKTLDLGSSGVVVPTQQWYVTDVDVSYVELITDCKVCNSAGGGYFGYFGTVKQAANDKLGLLNTRNTDQSIRYVTIRYTKSTDTAGSGKWASTGEPAHHYSTDEQIIGTWIDGSTLYEKTLVMPSAITVSANGNWISAGVSAPSGATVIKADIVNLYVTGVIGIYVNNQTQEIYLSNIPKTADITIPANTPITIRYTKSSS